MRCNLRKVVMKLTHIFAVVVLLHVAVVGTLLVFPGCKDMGDVGQTIRPQGDRGSPDTPFGSPPSHGQETVATPYQSPESSPDSSPALVAPTKPSWNIATDSSPAVIEGEAVYQETDFNAINPELGGVETVMVEETVVTTLPTEQTYTVKKGDNLTKIARAQGVTLSDLMAANGLKKDSIIQIGQTLIIPADSLAGPTEPVAASMGPSDIGQDGAVYEVQRGDTLGGIAKRYGTTVSAIRGVNGLSGNAIYAGQTLLIPEGSVDVPAPPPVAPAAVSVGAGESSYVVQSGDTLGAIAKRYGVTVRELAARNNISDPRKLRAGQTLVVPVEGAAPAPKPAPKPVQSGFAPVPAPSQPVIVEEVIVTEEIDLENLDDIPVVPVQTSE